MTKQVPEGVVSGIDQIEALKAELLGNQVFGKLRGKLDFPVTNVLRDLVQKSDSPSAFCRLWDEFAGEVRVMGNKLAQLERDGWHESSLALCQALFDGRYMFPGETVPVEKTVPVTLIMNHA